MIHIHRMSRTVVGRVLLFGLILNLLWEFAQAGPLYSMWAKTGLWRGLYYIGIATLGDGLIVLGVAGGACLLAGLPHVRSMDVRGCLALLGVGLISGVVLEWIPRVLGWWTYNEQMPVLLMFGTEVGLAPVLQATLLPALSVYLGTRLRTTEER